VFRSLRIVTLRKAIAVRLVSASSIAKALTFFDWRQGREWHRRALIRAGGRFFARLYRLRRRKEVGPSAG